MKRAVRLKYLIACSGAAALFLVVLWMVPHTPEPIYRLMQQGTGELVVYASHLLGLSANYNPATQLFNVAGFDMRLLEECIALHYHAILTLAILLTPKQPLPRKFVAILCCNVVMVAANIVRLIMLGVIGQQYPELFNAAHDYLWQIAFAILTFFLCVAWTQTSPKTPRTSSGILLSSLVFSGVFAVAFNAMKLHYLGSLAWLSDKILLLTNLSMDWSSRWWLVTQKNYVMVRLLDERIEYVLPGKQYTVNLWPDMLGLVLFLGFCAGSLCWLWWKRKRIDFTRHGWGLCVGTLLLVCVHVAAMVLLGWLLLSDPHMDLGKNYLWVVRGMSVILPITCWWVMLRNRLPSLSGSPVS